VEIFKQSIAQTTNLRYSTYRGSESKFDRDIVKLGPWPYFGVLVKKSECVGHVQKRDESELRTLR